MVFAIKRDILGQLRRIGLDLEPLMLRVMPPSQAAALTDRTGIGRTFYIDLADDAKSLLPPVDQINQSLSKVCMVPLFPALTTTTICIDRI